jgi:hypothetical protein
VVFNAFCSNVELKEKIGESDKEIWVGNISVYPVAPSTSGWGVNRVCIVGNCDYLLHGIFIRMD